MTIHDSMSVGLSYSLRHFHRSCVTSSQNFSLSLSLSLSLSPASVKCYVYSIDDQMSDDPIIHPHRPLANPVCVDSILQISNANSDAAFGRIECISERWAQPSRMYSTCDFSAWPEIHHRNAELPRAVTNVGWTACFAWEIFAWLNQHSRHWFFFTIKYIKFHHSHFGLFIRKMRYLVEIL